MGGILGWTDNVAHLWDGHYECKPLSDGRWTVCRLVRGLDGFNHPTWARDDLKSQEEATDACDKHYLEHCTERLPLVRPGYIPLHQDLLESAITVTEGYLDIVEATNPEANTEKVEELLELLQRTLNEDQGNEPFGYLYTYREINFSDFKGAGLKGSRIEPDGFEDAENACARDE